MRVLSIDKLLEECWAIIAYRAMVIYRSASAPHSAAYKMLRQQEFNSLKSHRIPRLVWNSAFLAWFRALNVAVPPSDFLTFLTALITSFLLSNWLKSNIILLSLLNSISDTLTLSLATSKPLMTLTAKSSDWQRHNERVIMSARERINVHNIPAH